MKKDKIQLPDGSYAERQFDRALVMDESYEKRYKELLMDNVREGLVLTYVISNMNSDNELICNFATIANDLNWSYASVARAVKQLKDNCADLVTVGKFHGISRFTIDKNRCFKSIA